MIDDQIDRLTKHLEERGLVKKTLVVFTSDHGDYLMDYGLGRKGVGLYEDLTHTPQIWWAMVCILHTGSRRLPLWPTSCRPCARQSLHRFHMACRAAVCGLCCKGSGIRRKEFRSIYSGVGLGGLTMRITTISPLRPRTTQRVRVHGMS